jgi:REP-associated tyrosine transposase
MPRTARLVVPHVPHLVTQRGEPGRRAFSSEADYGLYLDLLGKACAEAGTALWAWCLLPDRVHLVLVPAHADGLRAALGEPHRRYAWAVNRREGRRGPLWRSPFSSFPIDDAHLPACLRYVELKPVLAGLAARPEQWPWSSARAHLGLAPDPITDPAAMLARVPDWRGLLDSGLDEGECARIEAAGRSGAASRRPRGRPRRAP